MNTDWRSAQREWVNKQCSRETSVDRWLRFSIQPRIRLGRSFDQRAHTYLGYALRVRDKIESEDREFLVGVGEGAHAKHQFRSGDAVSGDASTSG